MLNRLVVTTIVVLLFFFQFLVAPAAYAVPAEDIDHHLPVVYWQKGSSWRDKIHLNGDNTIGDVGCTLTSLTMLYIYHGSYYLPDSPRSVMYFLDPGKFNDWMVDNDAYTDEHDVDFDAVGGKFGYRPDFYGPDGTWLFTAFNQFLVPNECCDDKCLFQSRQCFRVEKATDPARFTELLERDTADYMPNIMKIKWRKQGGAWHEPHFVVVGGYDLTNFEYRDYDPGRSYKLPAKGFNKIYDAGNYDLLGLRRFAKSYSTASTIDVSALYYTVHSPVEIQVVDPQGRKTGYDPTMGTNLYENPMSDYYVEQPISSLDSDEPVGEPYKELKIVRPLDGNYILKIFGAGDGLYTINIKGRKSDGTVNLRTSLTGTATPSLLETYRVTYSPTGEASLSQSNQAPVANAGSNQTGEQSYEITIGGSASHDPNGDPLIYTWSFLSKPNGSEAALSDAHAIKPTFTPDLPGTYTLQLVVNDHFIDSSPSTVTIIAIPLKSRISVIPNSSLSLSVGSGFISFDVNNIGRVGVTAGVINISFTDPAGTVVYAGNQSFSIGVGGISTVNFPVTISPLKFGNYTLTYSQSDETRTGTPTTITIPNSSVITFSFDKTIYRVRETTNLTLNLINTGKFNLDGATVTISAPDLGYTDARTISLGLNPNTASVNYAIPISANVIAGQHNVSATLTLPSGSSIMQSARFALQDSTLVLEMAASSQYAAGGVVALTMENQGSVDTTYTTQTLTLSDNNGRVIYQGSASDTIMAGEKKTLANLQIPTQISGSMAFLTVILQDVKTGKLSYLDKSFSINSLQAGLLARTDKDVYTNTEAVAAISTVANNAFNIENGTIDIKVNRYKKSGSGEFSLFVQQGNGWSDIPGSIAVAADGSVYATYESDDRIKKFDSNGNLITTWGSWGTGNGQFMSPAGIAVSADGPVYVVDSSNNRIQKFDSNGNFIKKWGSRGAGNGQFYYPDGIAVAADGSVYVMDTCNNRVQKFDSNGNFITKWGSYGTDNGQFNYPYGIAVAADGSVYVADHYNSRIQRFDGNGNFITKLVSYDPGNGLVYFPWVYYIAVAADGSIYVTDENDHIQKFDSNGNFIKMWMMDIWGIATASDGAVFVTQRSYYTGDWHSSIQKMVPFSDGSETLFETNVPIVHPASTTQDYTTSIGILNATGKLYLDATLKNSLGQTVADSEYPFYIVKGNAVLSFSTDKRNYKPGETVTIAGEVKNLAAITASGLNLAIGSQNSAGSQNFFSGTFDVPANGSHPFTATSTAFSEGAYTITGTVTQDSVTLMEIIDQYEVAAPKVSVSISGPDVVGSKPFGLNVRIVNTGKVDANIYYVVSNNIGNNIDSNSLTIPAGQTMPLQYTQQIIQTAMYNVTISGDVGQSATKAVIYGEAATITIGQGSSIYPEGTVSIPVTVSNMGSVDETVAVNYQLSQQSVVISQQTKTYYLPKGGSIADTIAFTLAKGSYQLTASCLLPTAATSTSFLVAKDPAVSMDSAAGSQGTSGLIPLNVNVVNNGYNDLTGRIVVAVMDNFDKAVWRGEGEVAGLKTQMSQNYVVNVVSDGILPGAYSTSVTLYSTAGQQLATNQTQVRVLGPIFEIVAAPADPSFTVGKPAALTFGVKNTGTLAGSASLSLKAADLLNQSVSNTLQPGEMKYYAFNFTVPEDAVPHTYLAEYTLTPVLSQGTMGQTAFQVAGVNVDVQASLDKDAYRTGETAVLTLSITKQSQSDDGTYLAIIRYGTYHDMQTFILSSQPVTLTFRVPLNAITGARLFYGIHFESGRKVFQNSLVFNPLLPDLVATFDGQSSTPSVDINNTTVLTSNILNIGKTASGATTVALYDGDSLIDTSPVRAINPGDTDAGSVVWNVLGKAGLHVIKAVADPQDIVIENSETDNTATMNVTIPDITVYTSTDTDVYKIRQKVYIRSIVTNLTLTTAYNNLTLTTEAKAPSGDTVYTASSAVGGLAATGSTTATGIWNTAGLPADGAYTITQTVTSGVQVLAQSSKTITLVKAPDFILTTDTSSRKIKQGEKATYLASLMPFNGWDHEVSMGMDGLPAGTTVMFSPGTLLVPGQSQAVVISTDGAAIGANTIYLTAQGVDEGEIVSHTVPLTLDVSGFGIETAAPKATILQLQKAVFPISFAFLNGYEGIVTLSVSGMPNGTKAFFDNGQYAVPGTGNFTVLTSKYAKPGTYTVSVTGYDGLVKHKLDLTLVLQPNPDIAVGIIATEGPGPQNDALVRLYNSKGQLTKEFTAFDTKYGASAISADIDGDGYDEIIVAEGPGPTNPATLRAYKRDGTLIAEYTAFDTKYGLTLAAADLDGDWADELIVGMGPDPKNSGTIKILKFNGTSFTELLTQTIYPSLMYGINIAAGDVDGDGVPEIITAPGPGPNNAASIMVWKYNPAGLTELSTFSAFDGLYGANIATGDVDGDGKDEIIAGTGPDPKNSSLMRVYKADGTKIKEIVPYDAALGYGVSITSADLDGDGVNEIITGFGPGPQNKSLVKIFKADGTETAHFTAYSEKMGYGVRVSAGNTGK